MKVGGFSTVGQRQGQPEKEREDIDGQQVAQDRQDRQSGNQYKEQGKHPRPCRHHKGIRQGDKDSQGYRRDDLDSGIPPVQRGLPDGKRFVNHWAAWGNGSMCSQSTAPSSTPFSFPEGSLIRASPSFKAANPHHPAAGQVNEKTPLASAFTTCVI